MTTFTSLETISASPSGSGTLGFTPVSSARLGGTGTLSPSPSLISGGVILRGGLAALTGNGALSANLRSRRPMSASISGVGSMRLGEGAYAALPAIIGLSSNRAYGSASSNLPAMTSEAHDPLLVPSFGNATSTIPPLVGAAAGLTGTITVGTTPAVLPALVGQASNRPYASSSVTFPPFFGIASEGPGAGFAVLGQFLFAFDSMVAEQVLSATLFDGVEVIDSLISGRIVPVSMLEDITITPVMIGNGIYGSTMLSTASVISASMPDGTLVAWVVHTDAEALPSTMYDAYGFTSMAKFDGKYYGIKDDGIYELIGATDAGAPIVAQLLLPKDSMGTEFKKKIRAVYAAMQADGNITVTVEIDSGATYDYTLPSTTILKNMRAEFGRGLESQYWQLTLTNADGADFKIDGTLLLTELSKRRL